VGGAWSGARRVQANNSNSHSALRNTGGSHRKVSAFVTKIALRCRMSEEFAEGKTLAIVAEATAASPRSQRRQAQSFRRKAEHQATMVCA